MSPSVVTGCASGIGAAVVDRLLQEGTEVLGLDIRPPTRRPGLLYHQVDLGDAGSIDRFASSVDEPLRGLYNCAGLGSGAATPLEVMAVNFLGLRHLTERLVDRMGDGAAVVSVASIAARGWDSVREVLRDLVATGDYEAGRRWCQEHPDRLTQGGYRFSKQAVLYWTMYMASPLADRHIRINCVSPGVTDTPMLVAATADLGPEKVAGHRTPMNRMATPGEQADALVYLNSERASYITGANLWVDGGYDAAVSVGRWAGSDRGAPGAR